MSLYIAAAPLSLGILLGGMAFFSFLVAPKLFQTVPEDHAARFVRAMFPTYYLFIAVFAAAAGVGLVAREPYMSKLMIAVAAVAVICRQILTPAMNRASDAAKAGDGRAGKRFDRLHKLSVVLNFVMFGAGLTATVVHV